MEFFRPEYWSGLPFPSMGDIPDPGIKPVSPVLAGRFFTTEPPGRLPLTSLQVLNKDQLGFPGWLRGKESACNAGDMDSVAGLGRSAGEGNGNPLLSSCLGNPMDRGAWWAMVYGVTRVGHDGTTKPTTTVMPGSRTYDLI